MPGLAGLVGANRGELQVNGGSFAALDIKGPTASYFGGAEWKFINQVNLQVRAQLLYLYEQSKLDGVGTSLADEQFRSSISSSRSTARTRRFNGVDLLEINDTKIHRGRYLGGLILSVPITRIPSSAASCRTPGCSF